MTRLVPAAPLIALCLLLTTPASAEERGPSCPGAQVNLNLVDTDLPEAVALISQATGRRFILSGGLPAARITILSPRPVCPDEAYEAFLSALAAQGLTVLRRGRFHVVMTMADAVRGPVPLVIER